MYVGRRKIELVDLLTFFNVFLHFLETIIHEYYWLESFPVNCQYQFFPLV